MELEGRIIQELPVQSGTSKAGNPWKKGEWVLETRGAYPRKVKFHIFGEDRLANLGPQLQVGKDVVLSFDLESREFNGRWYTDVSVYAVRNDAPGDTSFGGHAPQGVPFGAPAGYPPAPGGQGDPFGAAPGLNQPFAPAPAGDSAQPSSTDDLPF